MKISDFDVLTGTATFTVDFIQINDIDEVNRCFLRPNYGKSVQLVPSHEVGDCAGYLLEYGVDTDNFKLGDWLIDGVGFFVIVQDQHVHRNDDGSIYYKDRGLDYVEG